MMFTEFIVKSSKLNEIPKPDIKSQLKMKHLKLKIQEFQFFYFDGERVWELEGWFFLRQEI